VVVVVTIAVRKEDINIPATRLGLRVFTDMLILCFNYQFFFAKAKIQLKIGRAKLLFSIFEKISKNTAFENKRTEQIVSTRNIINQ